MDVFHHKEAAVHPLTHFSSHLNHAGLPGQCKDITSSDATKNSCKISWEAPEDDGGTPIVSYTLERREASKKTYMPVMSGENILTCNVKDLYVNCEYYFRVKAVNKVGAGEYLELRNPVITEEVKRKSSFGSVTLQRIYLFCRCEHTNISK